MPGEVGGGHAPFLPDQDGLVAVGGQRGLDEMLVRLARLHGQQVSADHRSSISVSKRSSMRTTPLPSADRRLPRRRVPPRALLVIWCSFVHVSPGPPRCAGHPAAAPTRPGTGPAIHRPRQAARGENCRPAAAPPGGPRQAPPPPAPAGAALPPPV